MPKRAHLIAGILAPLCIATFFLSTILVELFGSHEAVAQLKSLIVTPGLWILIPAMAAAGGSGMFLGRSRKGRLVDAKKKRMPFIAANGLLVLVPCAIVLNRWAAAGAFDTTFYVGAGHRADRRRDQPDADGPERARRPAHGRAAARGSAHGEGALSGPRRLWGAADMTNNLLKSTQVLDAMLMGAD